MDSPWRRVAAVATWIVRGDESRRRRGCDVDSPWRRVAAVATWIVRGDESPRPRRENSAETSRGDAAAPPRPRGKEKRPPGSQDHVVPVRRHEDRGLRRLRRAEAPGRRDAWEARGVVAARPRVVDEVARRVAEFRRLLRREEPPALLAADVGRPAVRREHVGVHRRPRPRAAEVPETGPSRPRTSRPRR